MAKTIAREPDDLVNPVAGNLPLGMIVLVYRNHLDIRNSHKAGFLIGFVGALLLVASTGIRAQDTIIWSSSLNGVNRTSTDAPMNAGFRFQLGVFTGSFVPTPANTDQWAANWVAAQHTTYLESTARFADSFYAVSNALPFSAGKAAYVWGFSGDATSSEWILFRATSWNWPDVTGVPEFLSWRARDATPVIGQINYSLSPFQMISAAVTNAAPPTTTWDQWVAVDLDGELQNGSNDDPDNDGIPNLIEFVFGTNPTAANTPTATPVSLVDGHLVITVPRRIDRPANLVVEVSGDLFTWNSGPAHTVVLSNGLTALVVRDLSPFDPANPQRFARLKASLP